MKHTEKVWYGGDYNPEQWQSETWDEDFKWFEKANVTLLTLPVFSWARIEKSEGNYDFDWLIEILDRAKKQGISVCLATATAVQPAWLSKKYPEILPTDPYGMKRRFGGRVKYCPNSEDYKIHARKLVKRMAEIASQYDNVILWHIGNEYDNYCYCDHCKSAFQNWAEKRYKTIENLNQKWYLSFWGHELSTFDEIEIPDFRSENWEMGGKVRTNFQAINLDYMRFMNDSILSCFLSEKTIVNEVTPEIPVTTNFMGAFKPIDYFKWSKHLDIISWDYYPALTDGPNKGAMLHDLMRSLKKETPFWLMEQSPSQQNWAPYNTLKRPGQLRLQSYQTLAHGADAILYFQMRRSLANCEKFHGALIDHFGGGETRVFKECQIIGEELSQLNEIIGSIVKSEVGIIFDWENWWAIEMSSGPSIALDYLEHISLYYDAFYRKNQTVDFVNDEDDYHSYKVIVAPMLYMVKPGMKEKLESFVKNGGTLVLTTFSGIVNENDHVTTKGYPGELRGLAGIWVEEIDGLMPQMQNAITGYGDADFKCHTLCDIIRVDTADVLATYKQDFYQGAPVVTVNRFGKGKCYYIGTVPESAFLDTFLEKALLIASNTIGNATIEIIKRLKANDVYTFYLNHGEVEVSVEFEVEKFDIVHQTQSKKHALKSKDILIIKN